MSHYFEFESRGLWCHLDDDVVASVIRVYYDLQVQPWEIEQIVETDTGREFKFDELPVLDGLYILKRLSELASDWVPREYVRRRFEDDL